MTEHDYIIQEEDKQAFEDWIEEVHYTWIYNREYLEGGDLDSQVAALMLHLFLTQKERVKSRELMHQIDHVVPGNVSEEDSIYTVVVEVDEHGKVQSFSALNSDATDEEIDAVASWHLNRHGSNRIRVARMPKSQVEKAVRCELELMIK